MAAGGGGGGRPPPPAPARGPPPPQPPGRGWGGGAPPHTTSSAVLHPARLRQLRGFDQVEAAVAEVGERLRDEVDVLLDRHRHVRQHRRAVGACDEEEVGEALHGQAEIRGRPVGPLVLQRDSVTADDVDGRHCARDCVESGREHDRIEFEGLCRRGDSSLGDTDERLLLEVDEPNVGQVERGVVVGLQAQPFRADRVARGAQRLGRGGIVDRGPDLGTQEVREVGIGRGVAHHVGVEVEHLEQFALLPTTFVLLSPFLGGHREGRDDRAF